MRLGLDMGLARLGAGPSGPAIPQSIDLALYGTDATLADQRTTDGFYLFTTGATLVSRAVASATPLTGDALIELVFPGNVAGYLMPQFRSAAGANQFSSYADAAHREGVNTEGGGGGPNWVGFLKSGAFVGSNASGRNGNLYVELVGTAFIVSTGASYATRSAIYTGTRVDANTRYFAITDLAGAASASKSVRIRVRAHPGG